MAIASNNARQAAVPGTPTNPLESATSGEFNRPPRHYVHLPIDTIEVPGPPEIDATPDQRFSFSQLIPLLITPLPIILYALFSVTLSDSGSNSSSFAIIRLVSPIAALLVTVLLGGRAVSNVEKMRRQRQKEKEQQTRQNYRQQVRQVHEVLVERYSEQLGILTRQHPPLSKLKERCPNTPGKPPRFPDTRLWERRPAHDDFLALRVGVSVIPSSITVTYPDPLEYTLPVETQDALYEAIDIGRRYQYLQSAPLVVPLRERGAIGIVGPSDNSVSAARAMVAQLVMHHAPNEVALYIIAPGDGLRNQEEMRWNWARWLPHCNANFSTSGTGDYVARDPEAARAVLSQLLKQLNQRLEYAELGEEMRFQHVVIVVDADAGDHITLENPVFTAMLAHHQQVGLSVIFVHERIEHASDLASALIRLDLNNGIRLWYGEAGPNGKRIPNVAWDVMDTRPQGAKRLSILEPRKLSTLQKRDVRKELPSAAQGDPGWHEIIEYFPAESIVPDQATAKDLDEFARALRDVRLRTVGADDDIPNRLGFMEMYDPQDITGLKLVERWKRRPANGKLPLRAPIGVAKAPDDNNLLYFHLLEGADGPHGLVAGTTGSGKSELLQTIVTSLAIEHHPYFLSFFLIDYKGGSTFNVFRKLPHVVGNVSDLDPSEAERALAALKSEIKYRKRIFASVKEQKISDITTYHRLYVNFLDRSDGNPVPPDVLIPERMVPLPHLVIIIDEFAELKTELPHFMPEMARIARVGRSLGIHLILATQRPAGSVSEEVRANSQFQICLRVRSVADSRDMIRDAAAAYLPSDIPGRGYMQRGSDAPRLFQTAYVGGRYSPISDAGRYASRQEKSSFRIFWAAEGSGQPTHQAEFEPKETDVIVGQDDPASAGAEAEMVVDEFTGTVVERIVNAIVSYTEQLSALPGGFNALDPLFLSRLPTDLSLEEALARRARIDYQRMIDLAQYAIATDEQKLAADRARARLQAIYTPPQTEDDEGTYRWDWEPEYWDNPDPVMLMTVGLLDDPANRRQEVLSIDLANRQDRGHLVVYGAPSTGKTTALRTALLSLMQYHSPAELHLYLLDMGSKGLLPLDRFPHVGTYASVEDETKLRRLLRWLSREFRDRRDKLGRDDIYEANRKAIRDDQLDRVRPILVIAVDNIGELWEMFGSGAEPESEVLVSIAQDGINLGMVLVASGGNLYKDVPAQIVRSISHRIAFDMTETDQMQMVVGGRPPYLGNEPPPGRGMWRGSPPLQAQVAMYGSGTTENIRDAIEALGQEMSEASFHSHPDRMPHTIGDLPVHLAMTAPVISGAQVPFNSDRLTLPVGQRYDDLNTHTLELNEVSGHIFIIGKKSTGKSSLTQTIALQLARHYTPDEVEIVLIASDRRRAIPLTPLTMLPHVRGGRVLATVEQVGEYVQRMTDEFMQRTQGAENPEVGVSDDPDTAAPAVSAARRIITIIHGAQDMFNEATNDFTTKTLKSTAKRDEEKKATTVAEQGAFFPIEWITKGASLGLHFVVTYEHNVAAAPKLTGYAFVNSIRQTGIVCVTGYKNAENIGVRGFSKLAKRVSFDQEAGRGFVFIEGDDPEVVQFAAPLEVGSDAHQLQQLVEQIAASGPMRAHGEEGIEA